MAYGDFKSPKSSYSSGGRSRGYSYNAEEEAASKRAQSKAQFDKVNSQSDAAKFLLETTARELVDIYTDTRKVTRYGQRDWDRIQGLVKSEKTWADVLARIPLAQEEVKAEQEKERKASEQRYQEWQAERAKEAEVRQQEAYQRKQDIIANSELFLGSLQSETSEVFRRSERYDLEQGDDLEDPVSSRLRSGGWMEENRKRAGFKLQITASLDVSNSNWYNHIAQYAIPAFQQLVLALRALKAEHEEDVEYSAWLFSEGRDGKGVERLKDYDTSHKYINGQYCEVKEEVDDPLKETRKLFDRGDNMPGYAGEDSYIYPLFQAISVWEQKHVGDGYVKLDIILSDGVFERKVDISTADDIQARRGQVHSVVLNFMPEEDWYKGRLPYQVVQYAVTAEDITGILRLVLAQFLESYI